MSLSLPNNSNSSTNKLFLAGNDLNHSIYSTGSGGNVMYFNEYAQWIFHNIVSDGSITTPNVNCSNVITAYQIGCSLFYNTGNSAQWSVLIQRRRHPVALILLVIGTTNLFYKMTVI